MEKRFYSGVADLAFNEKSGAVLAVSRRQSDITRWNMGVDGKGQPLPGQDNYRDQIDNFLGKFSVRASARTTADLVLKYSDRKETLVSNLFRETRWDNNHAARGISVNIDHQFQGGRYSLQAGWDRALSNRVSVGDELVTFQPGACRNIRRAASARNRSSRTAGPSKAASTWIRCAPAQSRTSPTPAWNGSGCRPGSNASSNRIPTVAPTTTRAATRTSARSATCPAPWT